MSIRQRSVILLALGITDLSKKFGWLACESFDQTFLSLHVTLRYLFHAAFLKSGLVSTAFEIKQCFPTYSFFEFPHLYVSTFCCLPYARCAFCGPIFFCPLL